MLALYIAELDALPYMATHLNLYHHHVIQPQSLALSIAELAASPYGGTFEFISPSRDAV